MAEPWFDPAVFGPCFGAIAGTGAGLAGAVTGVLAGVLGPRGKGRRLVLGLMVAVAALGLVSFGFGLVALLAGQPYGIWYGPLLVGGIACAVDGGLIPVVRLRYAQAERRRLEAEGIRGS